LIVLPKHHIKNKLLEFPLQKPWMYLTINFITKLLLVVGKDIILVVCNILFKIVYFVATIEKTPVEELIQLFRGNIWKLYRFPESMILDKGS